MSVHRIIPVESRKLLIDVGSVSEEKLNEALKQFDKLMDHLCDCEMENVLNKEFNELTVDEIHKLFDIYKIIHFFGSNLINLTFIGLVHYFIEEENLKLESFVDVNEFPKKYNNWELI